jgi:hypothetical protein
MLVTVEGFGSIWSKRVRLDASDPSRTRTAYYNTTGITANGKLRHRSQSFGQLRFNEIGGFDPSLIEHNIGRVFHCTGDLEARHPKLVFHRLSDGPASPDYFVFAVTSRRTGGRMPIGWYGWKSDGVLLLSLSEFNQDQEAILLMPPQSWIRGVLGWFVAEPLPNLPWRAFLRLIGC